jgi:hypothetical protein
MDSEHYKKYLKYKKKYQKLQQLHQQSGGDPIVYPDTKIIEQTILKQLLTYFDKPSTSDHKELIDLMGKYNAYTDQLKIAKKKNSDEVKAHFSTRARDEFISKNDDFKNRHIKLYDHIIKPVGEDGKVILSQPFSKGTAFAKKPSFEDGVALVNKYVTQTKIDISESQHTLSGGEPPYKNRETVLHMERNQPQKLKPKEIEVKTFRYGTPFCKNIDLQFDELMDSMLNTLKSKKEIENNRYIIISLLDTCVGGCKLAADKRKESNIVLEEMNRFNDTDNICFINMSLNNNINQLKINSVRSDSGLSTNLNKLKSWIPDEFKANFSKILEEFEFDLANNSTPAKWQEAFLDETKLHPKKECGPTGSKLGSFGHREQSRYYMTCILSYLHAYLVKSDPAHDYILMYHCKSGQDRTGTFYSINQSCYKEISDKKLLNDTTDKSIDFFKKYFHFGVGHGRRESYLINNMSKHMDDFLFISYLINFVSTSLYGIKWKLGSKRALLMCTENKISYLLTQYATEFAGLSNFRGS